MSIGKAKWLGDRWHPFVGGGEEFFPSNQPPPSNVGPTAAFTASPLGLTVAFNGTSSGDVDGSIASYAWAFGDGTTGTGATVNHTYATSGSFTVVLTVTDDDGATATATRTITTTGSNVAPQASFTAAATNLGVTVNAAASSDSDGTIAAYAWAWGDGSTSTGVTASHTYTAAGTRTITLTVTDNAGASSSTSRTVTLTAPPTQSTFVDFVTEPTRAGFPKSDGTIATETNVGIGIWGTAKSRAQMTTVAGNFTVQSGQTAQDLLVTGRMVVASNASNWLIQNCIVEGEGATSSSTANMIDTRSSGTGTVRGCEIGAARTASVYRIGIGTMRNTTAYRNLIHHVVDACRMNTGTGQAQGNGKFLCNWAGEFLAISPDPEHASGDNKTHCDGDQIESGNLWEVGGNTFHGYHSTDGTSNVDYVRQSGSDYIKVNAGDSGAQRYVQATLGVAITTFYATNVDIHDNWFWGFNFQIFCGGNAGSTTGRIRRNKHERRVSATQGPFLQPNCYIYLDTAATGLEIGTGSEANVYMDTGTPVTVRYS